LFSFYVDGTLSSTVTYAAAIPAISAPLTIGQAENGFFMGGLEDEVTIYSRGLSAAEIQNIYLEGSAGKCGGPVAPFVVTQPQGQAVYAGTGLSLSVLAEGTSPLAYQWQFNGTNIPAAANASATNSTLVLANVQAGQAGNYSVVVSNAGGTTNSGSALITVLAPGSCLPPPANIVSWWGAEGTAADYEMNNPGALQGGAVYSSGEVGLAFDFRNGSGYVQVPDSPSLELGGNDFTIELWANFTSLSGSRALIAKDNGSGQANKWIFWLNGGQLQFLVGSGGSQTLLGAGAFSPALNTWHHLAVTRAGSLFSFYVDGTLSSTASSAVPIPAISAPLTIGQAENSFFMGGLEDEVTLYSRGLSAGEIQALYQSDSTGKCAPPTPPNILVQPQSQTVFADATVNLSALAIGSPPLAYQWRLNGTNISAAANATAITPTLTLTNVQTGQSGNYSVTVSNPAGSTNSANAMFTVRASGSCAVPLGVVSWWTAEGNTLDSSGTNEGALEGGATFAPGEVGQAFAFTNGSGYVSVPDSPGLDFGANDFTIELWANFMSLSGSQALIAKDNGSGQANKWIFWVSSGQLQLYLGNGSSQTTIGSGAFGPALNTWHHLAVTRSGSLFSFYVDGTLSSTATYAAAIPAISAPLTIGQAENGFFMGGLEDEVTIYSRGLSAAEIQGIYIEGSAGKCGAPVPPIILAQPQSEAVFAGANVYFNVLAEGSQPLTFQWLLNGTNISTATNAMLVLTNVLTGQSGNYSVIVSDPAGSTNSALAQLSVRLPSSCSVPSGVVSWWTAEGNATDSSGTNEGVLVGGVEFAAGEVGQAFSFTNAGSYVSVPDSPNLNFGGNDFTIELWANFASLSGSRALIAKDNGSGQANKWIFWLNGGQLQFYVGNGSSQTTVVSGAFSPALNTWHHLAMTRSGTTWSIYADGVLNSTASAGGAIPAISAPLTIGQAENTFFMGGLEDEVTIYSRGLSAAEIEDIYIEGSAGKCGAPVAPVITVQPQGQTVFQGVNVNFNVSAGGTPPLTYQWRLDGTNIPLATNTVLALTNVPTGLSGNIYSVTISGPGGVTNSANALLTVNIPACVSPPVGIVSWWPAEGSAADASGTNEGTLQGGAGYGPGKVGLAFAFTNGTGYVQVPDSPGLALGASDFSIELWANFTALGGSRVLIAKDVGPGQNNKWVFWLNGGQLQMLVQAGSTGFSVGTGAFNPALNTWHHLAVTRSGSLFSLYVDGALSSTGTNSTPLPIDGAPLTIGQTENTFFMGGLEDEVTIYSRALSAGEIQAIYTADSAGKCNSTLAPLVVTQPQGRVVIQGANVSFNALIAGSQPLAYQWMFNGTNISTAANPTSTNATLVLDDVQVDQSGLYSVMASNLAGSTNSAGAQLTVDPAGSCFPPPTNLVSWWEGESNAFDSAGANQGTLSAGTGFAAGEVGQAFSFNATNSVQVPDAPSLNFTGNTPMSVELWVYRTGTQATMHIVGKRNSGCGSIEYQMASGDGNGGISFGGNSSSTAAFTGTSLPTNVWMHLAGTFDGSTFRIYTNGVLAAVSAGTLGPANTAPFTIGTSGDCPGFTGLIDEVSIYSRALSADEVQDIYTEGSAGKCQIPRAPLVVTQPQSQTVVAGTTASLSVVATGTPPLSYLWQFRGVNISPDTNPTAASATLLLNNFQPANAGSYSVFVFDPFGRTNSAAALLSVVFPPTVTIQPPSQVAEPGCSVAFTSSAIGTGTITYQWQKNGTNLSLQTNTTLTLANIQASDFGNYTVVATSPYSTATSAVAVLSQDHLPVPGGFVAMRFPGGGVRIETSDILAAASDADGDPISLIAVATNSLAGGTVNWTGGSIYYLPPAGFGGGDAFLYTLSDGRCNGTSTGAVLVEVRTDTSTASQVTILQVGDGSVQVIFDGMPGTSYRIQAADTLSPPDWQDITNLTAGVYGTYIYTDWPATNGPVRFFRSVNP
jgi:hypothetical protein